MQNTGMDTGSMGSSAMTDPDKAAANVDRLSQSAHEMVDRMAESASSAAHRLSEQGHRLAEQGQRLAATGDHWAEMTRDCVRRHPFASVGVAVGAGMLLSLMTRRSGRSRRDTM